MSKPLTSQFPGQGTWSWGWADEETTQEFLDELLCMTEPVAFDTETTDLDPFKAQIVAVSFAGWSPMFEHPWAYTICFSDDDVVPDELLEWIESDRPKLLANAKYDWRVIEHSWGFELNGIVGDVMLMSQVLDDHEHFHNLDALALRHCELEKIPTWRLTGKGSKYTGWGPVPKHDLALYANEDVVAVQLVNAKLLARAKETGLDRVLELEAQLIPVVARMEQNGVLIDCDKLADLTADFAERRDAALERAREAAKPARDALAKAKSDRYARLDKLWLKAKKEDAAANGGAGKAPKKLSEARIRARTAMRSATAPLNLGSPGQLQELLYDVWELHRKLGLRNPPKTKAGNPATDKETLEKLAGYSEFCQHVLDYRQVAKLVSTYTEKMPQLVSPVTGRLHGSFWQVGTSTGRFSSSDPNLQNIPNRSEEGRLIRTAFIAPEGWTLLAADYSQIEPRVAASLSEEPVWVNAYLNDEDLYKATASAIWGMSIAEVPPEKRQLAKTVVLAALYGAGPGKIAATAKIPFDEAAALLDAFWAAVPQLRDFMLSNIQLARDTGAVWTMHHFRRRHIVDINHRWSGPRKGAENQAGNAPVQGTAADILKRALLLMKERGIFNNDCRLLLQVHDELVFQIRNPVVEAYSHHIEGCMVEAGDDLIVPVKVDIEIGHNWAEAH